MADTFLQLTIDDSSPSVAYAPFRDTLGPPSLAAGWNPYFDPTGFAVTQGQVANGTSQHITSLDGAALAVQWHGTGVQLWGNWTRAGYAITLDGASISPFPNASSSSSSPSPSPSSSTSAPSTSASARSGSGLLADIQGLPDVPHTITLTARIPSDPAQPPNSRMLVFDRAVVLSSPIRTSNITFDPQTLPDANVAFAGQWSFETVASGQFHSSKRVGDRAFVRFNGTTLAILGRTSPLGANYTVTLDNGTLPFTFPASSLFPSSTTASSSSSDPSTSSTLSARSSFLVDDALLFFVTGLDVGSMHSVEVRNIGFGDAGNLDGGPGDGQAELAIRVDGFRVNVPVLSPTPSSTPSPSASIDASTSAHNPSFHPGTIAAFVLAGILAFLLFSGLLFFFFVWRPRQRRKRLERKARASGFGLGADVGGWRTGTGALGGGSGNGGNGGGQKHKRTFPFKFRRTRTSPEPPAVPPKTKDMEELRMEYLRRTPPPPLLVERDVDLTDAYGSFGRSAASASAFGGSQAYGSSYGYAGGPGLAVALGIASEIDRDRDRKHHRFGQGQGRGRREDEHRHSGKSDGSVGRRSVRSMGSEFVRWTREAVEGSFGSKGRLPIRFRHSGSGSGSGSAPSVGAGAVGSGEDEKGQELEVEFEEYGYSNGSGRSGNGSGNGNGNGNGNGHAPRSGTGSSAGSDSTADSSMRRAITLARDRSKGKARQVMGISHSQSFTLDLPGVSGTGNGSGNGNGSGGSRWGSRQRRSTVSAHAPQPSSPLSPPMSAGATPSEQISSFAAADPPSPQGARAVWDTRPHSHARPHGGLDHPPSYAASIAPSNRDSNGSSGFVGPMASVPRSVSRTPENQTPRTVQGPSLAQIQTLPSSSPVQVTYPRAQTHQRENSRGLLLADEEEGEPEQVQGEGRALERRESRPLPRPPSSLYSQSPAYTQSPPSTSETRAAAHSQHASPAEVVPPRRLPSPESQGRDRPSSSGTEGGPSGSSLQHVIRSLRPRTAHAQPRHASYSSYVHLYEPPHSAATATAGHDPAYASSLGSAAEFGSLFFSPADVRPASTVAEEEESVEGHARGGPSVDSPTLGEHHGLEAPPPPRDPPSPMMIQSPLSPPPRRPTEERDRTTRKPLPRTPTGTDYASTLASEEERGIGGGEEGVFLDVRQTSPFRVDFGSLRERPGSGSVVTRPISMVIVPPTATTSAGQQTTSEDSSPDPVYSTAPSRQQSENRPSRRSSLGSLPGAAAALQSRMPEFVQGTSRAPFRLTNITIPTSVTPPPKGNNNSNSNTSSGGMTGTSFLDLTSSREGSVRSRSKSVKTMGSDQSAFFERPFGGNGNGNGNGASALGGELKSRWSASTQPSNLGPVADPSSVPGLVLPERQSTGNDSSQSQMASPSKSAEMDERMSVAASSTFPIPGVQVNIPPSPHHIMDFGTVQDEDPQLLQQQARSTLGPPPPPSGGGGGAIFPTTPTDPASSQRQRLSTSTHSQLTHVTSSTGLSHAGAHLHVHPHIDLDALSTRSGSQSGSGPSFPISDPDTQLLGEDEDEDQVGGGEVGGGGRSQRDSGRTGESSLAFHHALLHRGRRSPSPPHPRARSRSGSPGAAAALARGSRRDSLQGSRRGSRALGLPTPTSTMTLRTHGGRSPHPFANVSSVHDDGDDDDDYDD